MSRWEKKEPLEREEEHEQHADYTRNMADARKLKDYWDGEPSKIASLPTKPRIHIWDGVVDIAWEDGQRYACRVYCDQAWDEFRCQVTEVFRAAKILGERDDSKATSEWKAKYGVRIVPGMRSHRDMFGY